MAGSDRPVFLPDGSRRLLTRSRLFQSVAGRRLAAVAAVQAEPALQLRNLRPHRCHLSRMTRLLRQYQSDEVVRRQLFKGGAVHQLLGIGQPKSCQRYLRPAVTRTPNSQTITPPGRLSGVGGYLGSYFARFVARVLRPAFGLRVVCAGAAVSDRDVRCFSRLALISSRIIDRAALDTAARDCSGTASRASRKACTTGFVPRGRRVEAGSCFAMLRDLCWWR